MFRQVHHPQKSPIASKSLVILTATGTRMRLTWKTDAASSSHVRLQDAYHGVLMDTATVKLVATPKIRKCGPFRIRNLESRRGSDGIRPLGNLKAERTEWPRVSRYSSSHGSSHLDRQEIYGPEADDLVDDLDLNMAILEHISELTVRVEQLFNETGKLTSEQTEVTGVNTINLQRTYVDVHKLLAQQSLSDHQRQNQRLLLLSAL